MDEQKKLEAQRVYDAMCRTYEEKGLKFERHDEDLTITFGMSGDDLPMEFIVLVNPKASVVRLYSRLPVKVESDKMAEAALAVVYANSKILNGSFDLDISEGTLSFNVINAYHGSILGDEVFMYMLAIASGTIDEYNDRFLMLTKGMIDLKKFIELSDAE